MIRVSADDRPAHVADPGVDVMQHREDRLRQEEEPAPVDRVEKSVDALPLVFADGLPVLGAGEELCLTACAPRRELQRGQYRLGLEDVAAASYFATCLKAVPGSGISVAIQ